MSQITTPAMRKATRKAATGASARATRETSARGASSSRMARSRGDAHHLEPDLVAGPARPSAAPALSSPPWITAMRSAISNSSSRSWLMTRTPAPLDREIDQRLPDEARRAGVDAPGRLVDDEERRAADDLAADHEFLQVAARELARLRIARRRAHVEGSRRSSPRGAAPVRARRCRRARPRRVAWWERSAFSLRRCVGTAAWPSRSSGTKAAPRRRRASMPIAPAGAAGDRDARPRAGREPLAGERREQLALAVAGDAGDAEDLALPDRRGRCP